MSVRQQTVLERLRVKNFRSLVDVDLNFDRLVVLVGANGSGKSTVIDVVRFVRDALTRSLDDTILDRGGIGSIRRWSPRGAPDVTIQLWLRGANWEAEYSFVIGSEQRGAWRVKAENLLITQTPSDHVGEYVLEQPRLEFHIKEGKLDNTLEGGEGRFCTRVRSAPPLPLGERGLGGEGCAATDSLFEKYWL
ncbi:MAG: AAA family ATPase [Chloroflexales bacterium]|jgi:predicted ATPase